MSAAAAGALSAKEAAFRFLWSGAGGILVGLAIGWGIGWVRLHIGEAPSSRTVALTPFAAFIPAERPAVLVLAAVAVGLLISGRHGPRVVSPQTRVLAQPMWQMVTFHWRDWPFILVGLELPPRTRGLFT
jgi:CPA1 family monovalent cation:H+ antiporter